MLFKKLDMVKGWIKARSRSKKKGKRLAFFARVYLVGCESSRGSRVEKERC